MSFCAINPRQHRRRQEYLLLAGQVSIEEEINIYFQFRPQLPQDPVLEHGLVRLPFDVFFQT